MAPETILLGVILFALVLYAVLGGADFGGGVWEFNLALGEFAKGNPSSPAPARARNRNRFTASKESPGRENVETSSASPSASNDTLLIQDAIGPVWEANHVWLIFVLMALMTGFPLAFAAISRALWVPLLLALVGIVFRGGAFAFRAYSAGERHHQRVWGAVFALASTAAPFFMGASVGAIASGRLAVTREGNFTGNQLLDWISPLSIFTAFFAVGICAFLAAVYLTREAAVRGQAEAVVDWRRRALLTGLALVAFAAGGLILMSFHAPQVWRALAGRGGALVAAPFPLVAATLWALWKRHFLLADILAAATVGGIIVGLGVAQYPWLIPPAIDIASAKAADNVIRATLWAMLAGSMLLAPSLWYLFRVFKSGE